MRATQFDVALLWLASFCGNNHGSVPKPCKNEHIQGSEIRSMWTELIANRQEEPGLVPMPRMQDSQFLHHYLLL